MSENSIPYGNPILKSILFLLLLLLVNNSSFAQENAKPENPKKTIVNPRPNRNVSSKDLPYKIIKIITTGNEDDYYTGTLTIYPTVYNLDNWSLTYYFLNGIKYEKFNGEEITKKNMPYEVTSLLNSNTLIKLIQKSDIRRIDKMQLMVKTQFNKYTIEGIDINKLQSEDSIVINLNYDELSYKNDELSKVRETEIKDSLKLVEKQLKVEMNSVQMIAMGDEIMEKVSYYQKKLSGKTRNKIADILYHDGFSHDYFTGGTLGEKFELTFTYDGVPFYTKSFTIAVHMWYSYGFGNLYYEVGYHCYFDGKYYSD